MLTHKLYDNKYKIRIISLKKKQEKNDYLKAKGKKKEKDEFSMYQMLKWWNLFFKKKKNWSQLALTFKTGDFSHELETYPIKAKQKNNKAKL